MTALVAKTTYYHLGAFSPVTQAAIDEGTATATPSFSGRLADPRVPLDNGLNPNREQQRTALIECLIVKCLAAGEFEQAAGIALETHRLDMLEHAIKAAPNAETMLAYVYDIAQTLISNRKFRGQVLRLLAPLYARLPVPGVVPLSQIYVFLDDDAAAADLLQDVVARGEPALALQLAFDLVDMAPQHLLTRVRARLAAVAPATSLGSSTDPLHTVADILSGMLTQQLAGDFLRRSNDADLLILQTTCKTVPPNNSVLHSALVLANSAMYAGTASDAFLRDDPKWVMQATHWVMFDSVASLGVIHKGRVAEAATVFGPYLPKGSTTNPDVAGSSDPYEIGGGLYALG